MLIFLVVKSKLLLVSVHEGVFDTPDFKKQTGKLNAQLCKEGYVDSKSSVTCDESFSKSE